MNEFLRALKPFHDAGFINLLGVIAIFSAVLTALLPHFLRWSRRPKLHIAIPGNYFAPRQNFSNENIGVFTLSAPFILRNSGRSPASHIRAGGYFWLECFADVEPDPHGSQSRGQPGDR